MLPGQESASLEPLQPIKSGRSRKTPQPELPPQRSARRTPKLDRTQLQPPSRKTPATGITKKRGRPAKKATADELEDLSTSRITQVGGKGTITKERKSKKGPKEHGDAVASTAPEIQSDGPETAEAAPVVVPSTGVRKRKKRKSIGQQSTSRAKAAKKQSPLKPARHSRKKVPEPNLAEATEATDLDGLLAKETQNEVFIDAAPLDGGEPRDLREVAKELDSGIGNVEQSAENIQQEVAQVPKKRKRVLVEELPTKRVKADSNQSRQTTKAANTQKEIVTAEDALDAVQSMEKPAEVEAGSRGAAIEEHEAASNVAESRKEKPKKRKRVTVGQQSKKRAKAGITRIHPEPKAQEETRTDEDAVEAPLGAEKPTEVEVDSMGLIADEQEATAEEAEPQTQKPKRKKRKSIGQQKPKRKSVDLAAPNRSAKKTAANSLTATRDGVNNKPTAKRGRPRATKPVEETIEEPRDEGLSNVPQNEETQPSDPGLKSKPKAKRGRPKAKATSEDAVDEPDEEARRPAPEEEEDEVQVPILPEKKKRGRPRKADAAQSTSQTTKPTKTPATRKPKANPPPTAPKSRAPPKNSIPITIYAPPSPTSSDAEADPLSTSHPPTTTDTINPVDVLSQLCSELLSKSSSALAEQAAAAAAGPSSTTRSELKRTQQTTDLYAQELASRLLQLTTTLNANTSLTSRVKAAAKEERRLKKELKGLEREREGVRGRREEVVKERKKMELEDLLSGIAGAVKRGWDMQKEGQEGDAVAGMVEEGDMEV